MDREYMAAWKRAEETGRWPDAQYTPTEEDDLSDPETLEVIGMVVERDAHDNAKRRERELMDQNAALRRMLEERGVDVDDALYGDG